MTKAPKDVGASARARLLALARERGEDFQLVLTRYAGERLLYRLAQSPHGTSFVLKGAALFTLWTGAPHRATRDVDLLGFGEASETRIRAVFEEIVALDVVDDGVLFDAESLAVGPIREEQEYDGLRVTLVARVTTAVVRLQIDIGFGDVVTPHAMVVELPSLLGFPAPRLRAYPRETVVAEKIEAIVQLGLANSRMKDFYDLAALSRMFEFEGESLVRAIRATFRRRGTALPIAPPVAFTTVFTEDATKNTQWTAFMRKSEAAGFPRLADAVASIVAFLEEPLRAAAAGGEFRRTWAAGGPWS